MRALLLVAERDGSTTLARIGVVRALNRHIERVFAKPQRPTIGTRKLVPDRWEAKVSDWH